MLTSITSKHFKQMATGLTA